MLKTGVSLRSLMLPGTVVLLLLILILPGCDRLSVKQNLEHIEYTLVDQDSSRIEFPDNFSGKVVLIGYIYTSCPDICPMITYNMREVQKKVDDEDFMLVSVSFDPDRDTPDVLAQYAKNFEIEQENWRLLTGNKGEIRSLMDDLEITTIKTPTRFAQDNTPVYFIDHTDIVSLIDKDGRIRRSYSGSELNSEEVVEDIRTLLDES